MDRREGEVGSYVDDPAMSVVGQDALLLESRAKFRLHRDPTTPRLVTGSNYVRTTIPHPYKVLDLLVHLHHPGQDGCVYNRI